MKSIRLVDMALSTTVCGIQPLRFVFKIQVKRHLLMASSSDNSSVAKQLIPFSPLKKKIFKITIIQSYPFYTLKNIISFNVSLT